jgi:hypothetical protein
MDEGAVGLGVDVDVDAASVVAVQRGPGGAVRVVRRRRR